jgi:adenosine deaminase
VHRVGAQHEQVGAAGLEPTRVGHGIKAALDPAVMDMLRERDIVLEICPSSNLNTRVVRDIDEVRLLLRRLVDHGVRFTISTDGPEMLRTYLREELNMLLRSAILSFEEVEAAIAAGHAASFVDGTPAIERVVLPVDPPARIGVGASG